MSFGGALEAVSNHESFLDELNEAQRKAVLTTEGPLLVLAGAGTGKTRVLTSRILHILSQGLAQPENILAVTFTNKAASEMKQRVGNYLGAIPAAMWVGTFHSMATRILRTHGEVLGIHPHFSILDDDDQLRLVSGLVKVMGLDEKQYAPKAIANHIKRWKDRSLLPHQLGLAMGPVETVARKVYRDYQERLKNLKALDFGDLLLCCIELFKERPDILETYQEQFKYILVDEYQDTNTAQYLWLKALASAHKNICCVGDDDQAIYSWRGAEVGNILRFEKEFEGAQVIRLEQNYRSTGNILAAAGRLIRNNVKRLGKELWTKDSAGDLVKIKHAWNSEDEARFVGNEIDKIRAKGQRLGTVAVLVRASFQTRELEERFLRQGIPYRVLGGLRFYERQEIRDAIAYIKFLINMDDGLAFERIINVPKRSIGEATLQKIHSIAQEEEISLARAAQRYATSVRGKASQALNAFFTMMSKCIRLLETTPPALTVKALLEDSGYIDMWKQEKAAESLSRIENLKELVNAIAEFDSLQDFLDHVSLVMDRVEPDDPSVVNVMTIHGAKGLEFDTVFLVGWEEGLFPNQRTLLESGVVGLEEERRLAYVALTRAKREVFISYCSHRKTTNAGWQVSTPSRFIRELPRDHAVFVDKRGTKVPTPEENSRDISADESPQAIRARYSI